MASPDAVELVPTLSPDAVTLLVTNPATGAVVVKIDVGRADAAWWCKAARYFLALRYGAASIRLVSNA